MRPARILMPGGWHQGVELQEPKRGSFPTRSRRCEWTGGPVPGKGMDGAAAVRSVPGQPGVGEAATGPRVARESAKWLKNVDKIDLTLLRSIR